MKILPEHIFEKTSPLSPDEVIRELQKKSEPSWDRFKYLKTGKTFAGQVLKNSFKLIRVDPVRWKNRPLISGRVSATDLGSKITIKVGYNRIQSVFFLSIFFIFIFFALSAFIPNKLVAASVAFLVAIVILGLLRLDFERECLAIENEFDKSL